MRYYEILPSLKAEKEKVSLALTEDITYFPISCSLVLILKENLDLCLNFELVFTPDLCLLMYSV